MNVKSNFALKIFGIQIGSGQRCHWVCFDYSDIQISPIATKLNESYCGKIDDLRR